MDTNEFITWLETHVGTYTYINLRRKWAIDGVLVKRVIDNPRSHTIFYITEMLDRGLKPRYTIEFVGYNGLLGRLSEHMQYITEDKAVTALSAYL